MHEKPILDKKTRMWGTKDVFLATSFAFVTAQVFIAILFGIASLIFGSDQTLNAVNDNPWAGLLLTGLSAAIMLALIFLYMHKLHYSIKKLGFNKSWPWKTTAIIFLVYVVYLFIAAVVTQTIGLIAPGFNPEEAQDVGFASADGWQLILAFIGLVVIPPIAEEFVFRGYVYKGLKEKWKGITALYWGIGIAAVTTALFGIIAGILLLLLFIAAYYVGRKNKLIAAAIVTSTLFGLVHMQWNIAIDTFVFSFALIYVLEKTKNLWASVALHALKNGVAFIAIFLLS